MSLKREGRGKECGWNAMEIGCHQHFVVKGQSQSGTLVTASAKPLTLCAFDIVLKGKQLFFFFCVHTYFKPINHNTLHHAETRPS